jgi:hypothetical protein
VQSNNLIPMYYTDISYKCPLCKVEGPIIQAIGNVITLHYVDTMDDHGWTELGELVDTEYRKSEIDGHYCSSCRAFIAYDLLEAIKLTPELFKCKKEE